MKISVCVPLYNGEKCIGNALESLRTQTRKPDQVVVQDDCSIDQGANLVKEFNDLPIKLSTNQKNLGMIGNWNKCIEKANCDIITFLHQDDGYHPEFLAELEAGTPEPPHDRDHEPPEEREVIVE